MLAFFFQAEDGIRGHCVTGVQTCALPISAWESQLMNTPGPVNSGIKVVVAAVVPLIMRTAIGPASPDLYKEIGRASCRERVEISGEAGALRKKISWGTEGSRTERANGYGA